MARNSNKDIDFLSVYKTKKKINTNSKTLLLIALPVLLILIMIKKVPPIPAMLGGVVLGVIFALIFQPDLLDQLIAQEKFHNTYQLIIQAVGSRMTLSTGVSEVDELLTTGGMEGMLDTVWLIIAALTFGGVMEASGSLKLSLIHISEPTRLS